MEDDNWTYINDDDVVMLWECENEDCEETAEDRVAKINPDWYESNGTPVCSCGEDMTYIKTMVRNV